LGDPVDHSVSDLMFEYFAQITKLNNYKHLKLRVSSDNIENLKIAIKSLLVFNIVGANITLPYKESVMNYLDEIDISAKRMGAVNTIVNKNGKLIGYNTDGIGAIKSIEVKLRPLKKTDKVLIFGAGGAARAIISSLFDKVGKIIILSRESDLNKAVKIKNDFIESESLIEIKSLSDENIVNTLQISDVVINATSVGMYPNNNDSILKIKHIESFVSLGFNIKDKIFFDAVFNPFITDFLKLAESYGSKICPGIYMMIYQGIEAFELWTGNRVKEEEIEKIYILLRDKIQSNYEK
jgi:shikimate dehydrogenase